MNKHLLRLITIVLVTCMLAACGGGGGGGGSAASSKSSGSGSTSGSGGSSGNGAPSGSAGGTVTYPSTGAYSWVLTESGTTTSPSAGLTFGHPSTPSVSYPVEPTSSAITDVVELDQGIVNSSTGAVSGLTPSKLLYITQGEIKVISLVANGSAPSGVSYLPPGANYYCKFSVTAIDYANPLNSRFAVSTAGADGVCGTSDDATGILVFNAQGQLEFVEGPTAGNALTPIATLRDPTTYAPIGWFDGQGVDIFGSSSQVNYIAYPLNSTVRLVAAAPSEVLTTVGSTLTLLTYSANGVAPTLLVVPAPACSWSGVGTDATAFYAYCNQTAQNTFSIYAISRTGTSATQLASGPGQIVTTALGVYSVYATVLDSGIYTAIAVNKQTSAVTTLASTSSVFPAVFATNTGSDFLWQESLGNPFSTLITLLGPNLQTLTEFPGGFPSGYIAPVALNLNLSENRSQFMLFTGYNNVTAYASTTLTNVDTANEIENHPGSIPTASQFGGSAVFFSTAGGGNSNFLLGFGVGLTNQNLDSAGAKVFSFEPNSPATLTATNPAS